MVNVDRYAQDGAAEWDDFVLRSRNGTFMHTRPYVEYHAARFTDASLVARTPRGRIVAALPANAVAHPEGRRLESHGGLTYGGWVLAPETTLGDVLGAFDGLDEHCRREGYSSVVYKQVPRVYHRTPSDEDEYALFLRGAVKTRHDVSSAVPLQSRLRPSSGRREGARRAGREGVVVHESSALGDFHALLAHVLADHHGATPTHSLEELALLREQFPQQIRLFTAELAGEMLAGALVYDCGQTVHTQYLASGERGRRTGALDLVVLHLMDEVFQDRRYLSFGISTEQGGRVLNRGLASQKEMFGGRAVTCATWSWRP